MRILVTGGAGFIGSNFVRYMLESYPDTAVTVLDKLTYAGNLENLRDVAEDPRYRFVHGDICDAEAVTDAMEGCDWVVNWAADSHVDRSLVEPGSFIQTDVYGVYVLLEEARRRGVKRLIQISTDEVYGSIPEGSFRETDLLTPSSPYSASKAGGEMMARAYHVTYGLPIIITRGSNTFGPYQYPEKLIPLFITNALQDQPLPLYGDGLQARDWLYVDDHADAISTILDRGERGGVYNVAAGGERTNRDVTEAILRHVGRPWTLVRQVEDRPAHDRRYAMDGSRLRALGWQAQVPFDDGIAQTVDWYRTHEDWWRSLRGDEWAAYYQDQYGRRLAQSVEA